MTDIWAYFKMQYMCLLWFVFLQYKTLYPNDFRRLLQDFRAG